MTDAQKRNMEYIRDAHKEISTIYRDMIAFDKTDLYRSTNRADMIVMLCSPQGYGHLWSKGSPILKCEEAATMVDSIKAMKKIAREFIKKYYGL